ncbi:MAG: hypothetical protein JWM57_2110 [Phycisphaerales bacterium]|nr:hypothetical protein [Phycisphaerales bacterium]
MKPDQIHLTDWYRLLFGQAPLTFMIEVAGRAIVTYVILLVAMRLMGKRVAGQMSAMEITIIVTLGAAIGVPLQAPDRGILPAIVILGIAIIYQRGLNFLAFCSRRAEVTLQGDVVTMVSEGRLDLDVMRQSVMSRERLFSALRQAGLVHLGQVKRCYLEADGHFSIYRDQDPVPGLCLMPSCDMKLFERQFRVPEAFACRSCGAVLRDEGKRPGPCPNCNNDDWAPAVQTTEVGRLKLPDELEQDD